MPPLDGSTAYYESTKPSLLAQEPLTLPVLSDRSPNWWPVLYEHSERQLNSLRNWRFTWWSSWMTMAQFLLPRRAKYFVSANNMNRGRFLNDQIIDHTATRASQVCGSGLWTGLTNPARPWFFFDPEDETIELDEEGKKWVYNAQQKVYTTLHKSNFYDVMAQGFQDVSVFGTAPLIQYEDAVTTVHFYLPCAGEYFLGAGSRFDNNRLYREFTMTVLQIVEMFGLENCPEAVVSKWSQGLYDAELLIGHGIEPNTQLMDRRDRTRKVSALSGRFAYRETYWVRGAFSPSGPLSLRGFNELPFMVARWWVVSNDPYGTGPGWDAIGDTKQLQQETLRKGELIEKLVRPPMVADPAMKNEPASILPGQITYANTMNGKPAFNPAFEVDAQGLPAITADIKDVQARIHDAFYTPLFMAITQMAGVQPRNELELTKRDLERLQVLGPFITRFENEVASPVINRTLSILMRRNMLPPMPESLRRIPMKITYKSMMRLAQQAAEAVGIKDYLQTIGAVAQAAQLAGVPSPARVVNFDEAARVLARAQGMPNKLIFNETEVRQHDEERMRAVQQEKAAQAAPELAATAVDAAHNLSQTPLNNGSALDALLGNSAPAGQI